jgi:hypothetical protein
MRISLFAVAIAAFTGLCFADQRKFYSTVTDCSGTPFESIDLP